MARHLHVIHFSPSGTCRKIAETLAQGLAEPGQVWDMLKQPAAPELASGDALLVALPVFSGRIPALCSEKLKTLRGAGQAAIIMAVYGNRAYEDALVEMADLLKERGFAVAAAAAFPAQHSIFTVVAAGRPDAADMEHLATFRSACVRKLENFNGQSVDVPGNRPYRTPGPVPLKPTGSRKCTACGICVKLCPVQAINPQDPRKTDKTLCISCTACISACPQKARKFHDPRYYLARMKFASAFSARKEPEMFI